MTDDVDADADAKRSFEAMCGGESVLIVWGPASMLVEKEVLDEHRAYWSIISRDMTQDRVAEIRASMLASIEDGMPELARKRPRKAIMNRLMRDLVAWRAMGADA